MEIISGDGARAEFQTRIVELKQDHGRHGAVVMRWLGKGTAPWMSEPESLARLGVQVDKALATQKPDPKARAVMLAMPHGDLIILGESIPLVAYGRAVTSLDAAVAGLGLPRWDTLAHAYALPTDWEAFMAVCGVVYTRSGPCSGEVGHDELLKRMDDKMGLYSYGLRYREPLPRRLELLFVEDDPLIRQVLSTVLIGTTHILRFAEHGRDAITDYCRKPPHMVFLDIELPDVTGHELLDIIHRHDPLAYAVMLTSHAEAQDVQLAKKHGAKSYVVKPFSRQSLQASIDQYWRALGVAVRD